MTERMSMPAMVNGTRTDKLPVFDRGLLYGDGVFETVAVEQGRPRFWSRHIMRLRAGCDRLGIPPVDDSLLEDEAGTLVSDVEHGVLKLIVTRGSGGRGYRTPEVTLPARIMQLHPWPAYADSCAGTGVAVRMCKTRLGTNPVLAGIKHLNRLEQVIARNEWNDSGVVEGLMTDRENNLIEGTMSNLFLLRDQCIHTPDLSVCGVAGVMRSVILELASAAGLEVTVRNIGAAELAGADEIFLTNSLIGIWPVVDIAGRSYRKGPLTTRLQRLLQAHTEVRGIWRA
ncbi:MAG: aminodeoxychorismate lyase [Gammaproteobacteria bacterium]